MDKDAVDEGVDAGEHESIVDTDIENLNKTIKQLSTDVAELKTELETTKQNEFDTTEENIRLSEVSKEINLAFERNVTVLNDMCVQKRYNRKVYLEK